VGHSLFFLWTYIWFFILFVLYTCHLSQITIGYVVVFFCVHQIQWLLAVLWYCTKYRTSLKLVYHPALVFPHLFIIFQCMSVLCKDMKSILLQLCYRCWWVLGFEAQLTGQQLAIVQAIVSLQLLVNKKCSVDYCKKSIIPPSDVTSHLKCSCIAYVTDA